MDRREFLRRTSLALAAGVAVDQLDLLERMKAPVKYFFGQRVGRVQVYTIEATIRDIVSGQKHVLHMKPDVPITAHRAFVLEKVDYVGPMPKELEQFGLTRVNMPLSYGMVAVSSKCNLNISLPTPIGVIDDGDRSHPVFLPPTLSRA